MKDVQNLYTEIYKTLLRETKGHLTHGGLKHIHRLEIWCQQDVILLKLTVDTM